MLMERGVDILDSLERIRIVRLHIDIVLSQKACPEPAERVTPGDYSGSMGKRPGF